MDSHWANGRSQSRQLELHDENEMQGGWEVLLPFGSSLVVVHSVVEPNTPIGKVGGTRVIPTHTTVDHASINSG